ncbi:type III secretion target, IpaC/SipC family protein [Providencia rettgeri]|uniref:hypothetical protein n=1 Tax=Providencia TaxID=586 RepID=UPI00069FFD98|nr:hypothetical protein [Providencia rettgeri]ELR5179022.1 type III secretion target, IpaC/SipC family protein [Providencia rettgeri]ELR5262838.1 type III secretion target, IpaC/SipC family protein [Providencia rettgeri]MDK3009675.1 type III secretion target, IpaC/SipC family protein [Providencia rettgeri]HEM7508684.1 type III secretion target, IpaC/SipC family protein [Providencia rettgeri]HEM8269755.1 type III secretion target, IpaC/SipC family protein [Providencia rettgeri]
MEPISLNSERTNLFSGITQHLNLDGVQRSAGLMNSAGVKEISLLSLPQDIIELGSEKPPLKAATNSLDEEQILNAIEQLGSAEKRALLSDIRQFFSIRPEQIQQAVTHVLTEEKTAIAQAFQSAQLPDEMEIKQISQAIQVMIGSSFLKDSVNGNTLTEVNNNEVKSANEAKSSQFVGIISSDILIELSRIIRKVLSEINISDRRISADFLMLNAKMVEAAAESTINEGKQMMIGAIAGFCTSMAISAAGAGFQLKSLRTQNQSIKNNLTKANQNAGITDKLTELNKTSNALAKTSSLSVKGKDGRTFELVDTPSASQKTIASQRVAESAQRTNRLSQSEYQKHDQIMNNERTKSSIAEQGARLSDNAGQMATSANQINVKEEEANKMQQQSVADIARSISADKDKQIDKDKDLVKQMHEHLREIHEGQLRTFQCVVRG